MRDYWRFCVSTAFYAHICGVMREYLVLWTFTALYAFLCASAEECDEKRGIPRAVANIH